ncbi:MAG: hypothetical protein M0T84_12165 [Betaproteobacteria bacterium]|nr:hypothetical protein [Betaproteobacteria bacterium]
MKLSPSKKAALLYVFPILALVGMWCVVLFVANPPASTPVSLLAFLLTESPCSAQLQWLLVLPALCVALSAAYSSRLPHTRAGALALLSLGVVLAVAAWLTVTPKVAFFVSLPLLYGFSTVKEAKRILSTLMLFAAGSPGRSSTCSIRLAPAGWEAGVCNHGSWVKWYLIHNHPLAFALSVAGVIAGGFGLRLIRKKLL